MIFETVNDLVAMLDEADPNVYDELLRCMCAMRCAYTVKFTDPDINDDNAAFARSVGSHMSRAIKAIIDDWR